MKIGLVCPYDIFRGGGVPECVMAMKSELSARGHTVKILTPGSRYYKGPLPEDFITVGGAQGLHRLFSTQSQVAAAVDTEFIDNMLEAEKFDLLHFHEPWIPMLGLQLLSRSKCINVGTFHAKIPDQLTTKTIVKSLSPYGRSVVKYLHEFSAVSPAAAELIETITEEPVVIIPNGVDVEKFRPKGKVKKHNPKTIFYVGRLEKRKGVRYLLDAFYELAVHHPDVQLLIAGDGPERKKLEERVAELNIPRVQFLGYITEAEKIKHLHEATILCSPARYGESFGIVLLEAMAAGLPVVAGDNPGYESVLVDRGALSLVDPQDTINFTRRLELFLYDSSLRELWLNWSDSFVKQFDYSKVVDEYEKLYEKAAKNYAQQNP